MSEVGAAAGSSLNPCVRRCVYVRHGCTESTVALPLQAATNVVPALLKRGKAGGGGGGGKMPHSAQATLVTSQAQLMHTNLQTDLATIPRHRHFVCSKATAGQLRAKA